MFRFDMAALRQLLMSRWIVGMIVAGALLTTLLLWMSERHHAEELQSILFNQSVVMGVEEIQHQVDAYRQILKGVEQLYTSSEHVSMDEFRLYVEDFIERSQDDSLSAIGFIKYIHLLKPETFADLDIPIQQLLKHVEYGPDDNEVAPVLYVEPRNDTNNEILLKNTFSHAQLRTDLLAARDGDRLVMSRHSMVEEIAPLHKHYVLHVPVYDRKALDSLPQGQRQLLNGWVFLRFDVASFLHAALRSQEQRQLHFDVFDKIAEQGQVPLYHSEAESHLHDLQARYTMNHTVNVSGQTWLLSARSTPAFEAAIDYGQANRVGVWGVLLSALLGGIAYFAMMRSHTQLALEKFSQEVSSNEQRWMLALESTGDGLWDWYVPESRIVYSDRWKSMFGLLPQEVDDVPDSWHDRIHPDDRPAAMAVLQQVLDGGRDHYAMEYRMACKDGSWKWVFDRGMVFKRDAQGKPLRVLGTLADISKIKQSEEVIWQYANVDTLTGLPNRRLFFDRLDRELRMVRRNSHKVAIIFLDLDRFKEVNDSQGHDQGDRLLQQAGQRLTECIDESGVVARLGGDEFVLMLSDAHANYVEDIAQKVLGRLAESFKLEHTHAYVSASLGIAIFPDDAANKDDLMKHVDQAMYASKQKGGNCFTYFTPRMQEHAELRMQLSHDLRVAINGQQFYLEYQPVVNLQTNAVHKAEALIRWQHPVRGMIPPMEFIGLAEDTLLIVPIGEWVFKTAIEQCRQWRESLDAKFQVAINKSPVQFAIEHKRHYDWVKQMLDSGSDGSMVVVEITERLLLDANSQVSERLAQYGQAGVQVALDDFGTGYSALSYLKKFDIDYVKIDRSFVRELGTSNQDEALCRAIIMMAHSLGMQVVAEGIENQRQLKLLREMGCDFGQGYYFSRPLRPDALMTWMQAWQQEHMVLSR
ncbi:PAS domain S-box-containing protein/diguanylate cyclase (GGDEF) domain-containing protein [Methylophilus rhizosphaerae]|uniref:PAS domain S-box-containing protein/diguanylate cyclase (GGDEF) domain-containing protein n=1 Tax=Methylophilus rhizosphaerae TaxID=492660 RepID=A0A1G9A754_9PROT|nr:EAL domain-containing protein [Methylophilus rhizosphaerae]SDK22455.1 PAS domain S-box-containing protein/diguanylate cyclase (GGDEF) domain-containing protein [Methylophilus rhizosphaerae]